MNHQKKRAGVQTADSSEEKIQSAEVKPHLYCIRLSPRAQRVLRALLETRRAIPREELDRIGPCSNSPDLISAIRRAGIPVRMTRRSFRTTDGTPSTYGTYWLDFDDRSAAQQLLADMRK